MKIYHNNRCSKSRQTLELINKSGKEVEIIDYLKQTPSKEELEAVLKKLCLRPEQIVRKGENVYKEQFANKAYTDKEWLDILTAYPVLIERPIVVHGDKAVIGRPPENVLSIL
jgi:arsenate reductase (glutaredoxin)